MTGMMRTSMRRTMALSLIPYSLARATVGWCTTGPVFSAIDALSEPPDEGVWETLGRSDMTAASKPQTSKRKTSAGRDGLVESDRRSVARRHARELLGQKSKEESQDMRRNCWRPRLSASQGAPDTNFRPRPTPDTSLRSSADREKPCNTLATGHVRVNIRVEYAKAGARK